MAEQFAIERAVRDEARLRLAVCAASNGGKTWTALEVAFGIVEEYLARGLISGTLEGKVGVIDTERKSSRLYAHLGPFDAINLGPPYSVNRYCAAMDQLEHAGYFVIVLDSISHAWAGAGGVLALLDTFESKDRFTKAFSSTVNPAQDEFVDAILRSPCHVVATMRSKTAWVLEDVESHGRTVKTPRRIGLAPVQRPGIEYEFTTLLDLDTDTHAARVVKNRCPHFANWRPRVVTREDGRALAAWLLEATPDRQPQAGGSPLERCAATAAMSIVACERCANVPDLARVYEGALQQLVQYRPYVPLERYRELRDAVIAAKDARKLALGGDRAQRPIDTSSGEEPAPAVAAGFMEGRITEDQERTLRERLLALGINLGDALVALKVPRLADVSAAGYQAALSWLEAEGERASKDKRPRAPVAKDHFADLKDDIPF